MLYSTVLQAVYKKLSLDQTIEDVSVESGLLGDTFVVPRAAAIYESGELNRVTGYAPARNRELELSRLEAGQTIVPPCKYHRLNLPILIDGNFYLNRAKYLLAGSTKSAMARSGKPSHPGGFIAANRQSHAYFGHWLTDELPLSLYGSGIGHMVTSRHGRALYSHEEGYFKLHALPLPEELPDRCVCNTLTILDAGGVCSPQIQQMQQMRATLRARWGKKGASAVFIRRGGSGNARMLLNESEVMNFLANCGFAIVNPEVMTAGQLAETLLDAEIVIGVEGSHLAHGLLHMSETGTLLVIQPPFRFNNPFKDLCDASGRKYGFTVGTASGDGFHQDISDLKNLLNKIEH